MTREQMLDAAVRRVYRKIGPALAREMFTEMASFGDCPAPFVYDEILAEYRRIAQEQA